MPSPYNIQQQHQRLFMASAMFQRGASIGYVRYITGLTLAAMKRARLIYEIMIPDPKGYTQDAEGNRVHNGHVLHTDQWRPAGQA